MMEITVKLHGLLRDVLPEEQKGLTTISLDSGATTQNVIMWLADHQISGPYEMAHNGDLVEDDEIALNENDRIDVFRPAAGG